MTRALVRHRNPSPRFLLVALISAVWLGSARAEPTDRPARVREAVQRAGPAVVSIRHSGIVVVPPIAPPALRWFGRPQFRFPGPVMEEQRPSASGVIVDAKRGLVLTSASVLGGASRVDVLFADGSLRPSRRVVFGDPRDGLALIEFDPQGAELPQAEWGDSESLQLGDDVIAVGRTAEGELLVSAGIVASERRKAEAGSERAPIATDALTTPETAGGPLLDLNGRVVGIRHLDEGFPARGFGSAAPATLARAFITEPIAEGGRPPRGHLGVTLREVARGPGAPFGRTAGAVVASVVPGSPAAEAGIEPGDRILSIDGRAVRDISGLQRAVEAAPVGTELTLRIDRRGEEIEIKARTRAAVVPPSVVAPEPGLEPRNEDAEPSAVEDQPDEDPGLPPAIPNQPESEE